MKRQVRCWFPRMICGAVIRSQRQMLVLLSLAAMVGTTSAIASRVYTPHLFGNAISSANPAHDSATRVGSESSSLGNDMVQDLAINPPPNLTQSLLLTVTPRGFDLKEITLPAVPFFLLVENRSGLSEMSLSFQVEGGPVIRTMRVQREDLDWAGLLVLAPGSYVISEASHPGQLCHLIVIPK